MGLSKSRTVTLIVALATLTSNTLSSLLFHQLPDDPYHLASNFGWYLHFANILSVFGFIGAVRQHALSIAIFSHYLIVDTILCAMPRFLVLGLLHQLSSSICTPTAAATASSNNISNILNYSPAAPPSQFIASTPSTTSASSSSFSSLSSLLSLPAATAADYYPTTPPFGLDIGLESHLGQLTSDWTPTGCLQIVWLAQLTLVAGVVAATLLQFVGALCVREYARCLWMRDLREEAGLIVEECEDREGHDAGVLVVFEEEGRQAGELERWGEKF